MNKYAILHNQYSEYAYAINKNSLHLLLRTAKGDLAKVELLSGDPFVWKNRAWVKEIKPMTLRYQTELFDYYFIEVKIITKRLRYAFILTDKFNNQLIYHSRGYMPVPDDLNFTFLQEFFNYPYILEADSQKTPAWVKDTVWYQIFVDRFNNVGVKSNHDWDNKVFNNNQIYGGNLKGVTAKLKYLKTLGYNGIYFNPLFEATTAHKYDTIDYFKIDPSFGTNEDFKLLVEEAHRLGIKVMLDGVFNHCSYLHPWFQDVIKNKEKSKYLDCFFINDWPIDHLKTNQKYNYEEIPNYEVFATTPYMPKWNTENPMVKKYLLDVVRFWIEEYKIDGWRLDVSNELSMKFLREIKNEARKANPDVYLLGENWDNSLPWLKGDQLDGVMNYLLTLPIWNYLEHKITTKEFEYALNGYLAETPKNLIDNMFNLVGCHDTLRITTRLDNNHKRAMLAYLLIYSSSGSVSVYYGDEVGMFGGNDPDNRRTMRWDELEWDLDTLKTMKRFNDLRGEYKALKAPDYYFQSQNNLLAYYKKADDEKILIVINNTKEQQTYQLSGTHTDIFSKQFPKYSDIIKLEPYGFMILKRSDSLKPTIKDVAKLANVSVSTVSRVINNKESVHEATRQIVLDAIDKLEFVPNQIARNLTSRSSQMIGVIVPHIGSSFYSDLLEGIEKKASSYGYHIIFCNTQDDLDKEAAYLKVFDQYKIDGLIVASNFLRIDDLLDLNIPTVTVDHVLSESFPSVTSDNIKGGELAAQELVDQGVKNVLLFRGPSFLMTTTERTMGCVNIFDKYNTNYEVHDFDLISPDLDKIEKILVNQKDLEGIICYGDNLAIATLSTLNRLGMKVPDDVLLIGYDNMPISKWITPSLTTVEQDIKLMGSTAFDILYNLIRKKPILEHNYIVDVELVTRNSTKKP